MVVLDVFTYRVWAHPMARRIGVLRRHVKNQQLPRLTRGVLRGTFQGGTGITPYAAWAARWGLAPLWGAAALIVLAAAAAGRRGD